MSNCKRVNFWTTLFRSIGTVALASSIGMSVAQAQFSEPVKERLPGSGSPEGGGGELPWTEYAKHIESRNTVATLGPSLLGDEVNFYNGALSFSATDVSLSGNSAIPVAISRSLSISSRPEYDLNDMPFGDWELDIPRLEGTFGVDGTETWPLDRCTNLNPPKPQGIAVGGALYQPEDYWTGVQAMMPGGGELMVADTGTPKPTVNHLWVTSGYTYFSCLNDNGLNGRATDGGEGFLAVTADGTRYSFTHMAQYFEPEMSGSTGGSIGGTLRRKRVVLYVSLIEDRFGNTVTYTYDNTYDKPVKLVSIADGAGRTINLTHEAPAACTTMCSAPLIKTVSDGTQTWQYKYTNASLGRQSLTEVILPDGSKWSIGLSPLSSTSIDYSIDAEHPPECDDNIIPVTALYTAVPGVPPYFSDAVTGTITHPSGATGTFVVGHGNSGRSSVPNTCLTLFTGDGGTNGMIPHHISVAHSLKLESKTITGPSLRSMSWSYKYTSDRWRTTVPVPWDGGALCTTPSCLGNGNTTTVTGPDYAVAPQAGQQETYDRLEWSKYSFGNTWGYNEGKLLKVERGYFPLGGAPNSQQVEETTVTSYHINTSSPATATAVGRSLRVRGDGYTSEQPRPQEQNDVFREGAVFSSLASGFDAFARPAQVVRSSTLGFSQTETIEYHDDQTLWVLGQVSKRTVIADGKTTVPLEITEFDDDTALPTQFHQFGRRVSTRSYHANGLLHEYTDESNQTTSLTDYQLGVPKRIDYADSTFESVTLYPRGEIWTHRAPAGGITTYTYDAMGRLSTISYPQGGTSNNTTWLGTSVVFAADGGGEFDMPTGTWKRTVKTGSDPAGYAVSDTYYDAFWRPLLTREYDSLYAATTTRVTRREFDHQGRDRFSTFPSRDTDTYATAKPGTRSWYDSIGRMLLTRTDSELPGEVRQSYSYPGAFVTEVTNARGNTTKFSYQAYDAPSTDRPIQIDAPGDTNAERIVTAIDRDVYGKPQNITRGTLTRRFIYDGYQRLCRSYDPESDWSVQSYHPETNPVTGLPHPDAGLVDWSANGIVMADNGACDYNVIADERTYFHYDARNRPDLINHPTDTADLDMDYEADGLLQSVSVIEGGNVINRWDYTYNQRRLLESELLTLGTRSYAIDHNYDAYGSRSQLGYPDGTLISFAPNRLGQPKAVGTLASNVAYQPSGAVQYFQYGNTLAYTSTPNVRQLPASMTLNNGTTNILSDSYVWDKVGNLDAVIDNGTTAISRTRSLQYDAANRLTNATYSAPGLGPYGYNYDIYDNIEIATRPVSLGGNRTYEYNPTTRRLDRLRNDSFQTLIGYVYDSNGNAKLRDASGLGSLNADAFYYDQANRLIEVQDPLDETQVKAKYAYDGHARRVSIVEDGEQRVQIYDQSGQYLYEEPDLINDASFSAGASLQGKPTTRYQYLGSMLVAKSSGNQTTYLHTDHLGSPIAESTAAPVQVTHLPLHEPYGAPSNGNYLDGPGYTGHVVDGLTGLSYMQARYYDPVAGRFLGVDPVGVDAASGGNFNRYWYGNDNPYGYVDPDGRAACGSRVEGNEAPECDSFDGSEGGGGNGSEPVSIASGQTNDPVMNGVLSDIRGSSGTRMGDGIDAAADAMDKSGDALLVVAGPSVPIFGYVLVGGKLLQISKKLFGHMFDHHSMKATNFLINRARGSGIPQGQFLDDQVAAQFVADNLHLLKNGAVSIPMPAGFPARIIMPDGSFRVPSTIRLVPSGKGVSTAYPEP